MVLPRPILVHLHVGQLILILVDLRELMLNSLWAITLPLDLNLTIFSIRIRRQHHLFLFTLHQSTSRLFRDHRTKRLEEMFYIHTNFLPKLDNLNGLA